MKGKNKLVFVMFAILALVATGVCFAFAKRSDKVNYVTAAEIPGYTADLDGIIFSAERVYIAESSDDWDVPLKYGSNYTFNQIETGYLDGGDNKTCYFGDIRLTNGSNYDNKDVIYDGDYVIVDDQITDVATIDDPVNTGTINIKQGIMITLGGYYFNKTGIVETNKSTEDPEGDPDKEPIEHGADISFVSVSARLNNVELTNLPSERLFGGEYADFTWFIPAISTAEGHYEISFEYMRKHETILTYEFDFYLLLKSKYSENVEVGGQQYGRAPLIENAEQDNNSYSYYLGNGDFPTLTFDYERYDVSVTHSSGDVTKTIEFDYNAASRNITLSSTVHSDTEIETYPVPISFPSDKKIVTLMFADNGKYTFKFKYIYRYQGESITIPENQEKFDDLILDIYGYQTKYSRAGVNSADMEYLEIYQNNTMFILLNGFTNASNEKSSANLGVHYKLIPTTTNKTGSLVEGKRENAILSINPGVNDTLNDLINEAVEAKNAATPAPISGAAGEDTLATVLDKINNQGYQKTDRGIWFALNDKYNNSDVTKSFYYHSQSPIDEDYLVVAGESEPAAGVNVATAATTYRAREAQKFTKVTTFTEPGYYIVQLSYIHGTNSVKYQYFAFQITSATPILDLYKTDAKDFEKVVKAEDVIKNPDLKQNTYDFYAHEFTNKNVYANWDDPDIFESTINGKLYYSSTNIYESESVLREAADRGTNTSIVKLDYKKNTIIIDSASYLLVLEVGGTATKTYTYFTIDKDNISGLNVHEMEEGYIDGRLIYRLKTQNRDEVTHTNKAIIDVSFALNWDDKASGAKITAKYRYTPFVRTNLTASSIKPLESEGLDYYRYIINEYNLGTITGFIGFDKIKNSLSADNVMVGQGVYEFALEDQAGNKLNYIVILDQTEGIIKATYGDSKTTYTSGQLVADYVEMDWGTHKAIDLGGAQPNTTVSLLLNRAETKGSDDKENDLFKYYNGASGSNLEILTRMFKNNVGIDQKDLLVVQNEYTNIRIAKLPQYYYRLRSDIPSKDPEKPENDYKRTIRENGTGYDGWSDADSSVFVTTLNTENTGTEKDLRININKDYGRRYIIDVKGINNVTESTPTQFAAYITPDKTLGQVYSSATSQQGVEYSNRVATSDQNADLNGAGSDDGDLYYTGQASDDGVFVYEWTNPTDEGSTIEVVEVKYDYYRLMDQAELNKIGEATKVNAKENTDHYYYPYVYSSTGYILRFSGDTQTVKDYDTATRKRFGEETATTVNRSNPINVGVETFYDDKGQVGSSSVTLTGLYIITRTIKVTEDGASEGTTSSFSYAFFVDRNMIISYNFNDIKEKLVGQFIHAAMPNTDGAQAVRFDNFTKQGVESVEVPQENREHAKIYLETNKLPTRLNVPSGKYVSGSIDDMSIAHTSSLNMKLRLSVYYEDCYEILTQFNAYKGSIIQIMDMTIDKAGYIDFELNGNGAYTYKIARNHVVWGDELLTLPGNYIFVVTDQVGTELDDINDEVLDYNKFMFGIKLLNEAPKTDVYAYANIIKEGSRKYSEDLTLYTNQQYVDFIIPKENKMSYKAQLDIGGVEIYRTDKDGNRRLWMKLGYTYDNPTLTVDKSGIENTPRFIFDNGDHWLIKLDTGLNVDPETNEIISYEECTFEITIKYILVNSHTDFYTYFDEDKNSLVDFYRTTYTVIIDRTPNENNINTIIDAKQEAYFSEYQTWLAEQNKTQFEGNINGNFAYRDKVTGSDYYGLTNELYYEYIGEGGTKTNQAMYAITVEETAGIDLAGLERLYWREIAVNSESAAQQRMGLLPINDEYFYATATEYYGFTEAGNNNPAYKMDYIPNDKNTYKGFIGTAVEGKLYEFVEVDLAGNYTQYVVYFKLSNTPNVSVDIDALQLGGVATEPTKVSIELGKGVNESFIQYQYVSGINNVAAEAVDENGYYPYYGKISVHHGRALIGYIYLNTTSIHSEYSVDDKQYVTLNSIEEKLNEMIQNEGNYEIEYINNLGIVQSATVNVYTSDDHSLNIDEWKVKQTANGDYYLDFSELNSRVDSNNNVWWFVTGVDVSYVEDVQDVDDTVVSFTASLDEGETILYGEGDDVVKRSTLPNERDRLYLAKDMSYIVTVRDVAKTSYAIPISTISGYIDYRLTATGNSYSRDNVLYTASDVVIEYDLETYNVKLEDIVYNGTTGDPGVNIAKVGQVSEKYAKLTLFADLNDNPEHSGSLRKFEVVVKLRNREEVVKTYKIVIDTRVGKFNIENLNRKSYSDNIKTTIDVGSRDQDGNLIDEGYNEDFIASKYYNTLISETVNISWVPEVNNGYFRYEYQLYEFVTANNCEPLLENPSITSYQIGPKEETTGKYIFKVRITDVDGGWIATRVFGILMSTTMTGLYEVTYESTMEVREYSSITNWTEIAKSLGAIRSDNSEDVAILNDIALKLKCTKLESQVEVGDYEGKLKPLLQSFGHSTAIPLYIANETLILNSNMDNGVSAECYEAEIGRGTKIKFYRVWRSNYQTFAVLMEIRDTSIGNSRESILDIFRFRTRSDINAGIGQDLRALSTTTIYDPTATCYELEFNSYYPYSGDVTPLEKHNKVMITIFYAGDEVNTIFGEDNYSTSKEFNNSGSYRLRVSDMAGNRQLFRNSDSFNLVLMRSGEMLYTMSSDSTVGGKAPIKYAYYDKPVTLNIDQASHYIGSSISVQVFRNSEVYTGYEHPTGSGVYTFNDYGTYLVRMSAKLANVKDDEGNNVVVSTEVVFTILNPNEARRAIDFTAIYGYDVVKVESISNGVYKDVTEKFMSLLNDKANAGDVEVYNRLITYERVVEEFGSSIKGKMKFRVQYKVQDDELLPARFEEFSFTLNNQTATLNVSIEPGGKTTKPVTIKFNAANIYELVGDCYIVINGEKVSSKIDASAPGDTITELTISAVGEYYVQLVGDSGNVISTFSFTIKEPMNTVSIILIVVVSALVIGLIATFIWLRTRMKVR